MMILVCLLNLVIWAMIILFVLWIVTLVLSMFIPGVPTLVPFPGSPPAGASCQCRSSGHRHKRGLSHHSHYVLAPTLPAR